MLCPVTMKRWVARVLIFCLILVGLPGLILLLPFLLSAALLAKELNRSKEVPDDPDHHR